MMADFLIAYWLHSTVLLAAAWCLMKIARPRSSVVRERLWKLAAVLPVLTAVTSVGFRSAKAVPFAERKATIVAAIASVTVAEPASGDSVDGIVAQTESANHPVVAEVIDVEQQAIEPVAPENVAESGSTVELIDRSFEPVLRFENPGDELPSTPHFEIDEAQQPSLAVDVPLAQPSVTTAFDLAWQPVWTFVSPALSAWVAIAVLWLLVRSLWFRSRLRKARRIDRGRAVEILRELCSHACQSVGQRRPRDSTESRTAHGLATVATKPIRLLIVPSFSEPAAFGIWRPTIVLPPSCEALPREELRAVLAHELGHIVRGDVWWLLIGRVLTTVLGIQPLNRIARREWTAAAECLCDSWAVDRGVERLTLARCLTALAEHRLTGVSLADALAAVGSPSSLRQRIERLIAEPTVDPWSQRTRRWLLSSSVIAASVAVTLLIPLPELDSPLAVADEPDAALIDAIELELSGLRDELDAAAVRTEAIGDPTLQSTINQLRSQGGRVEQDWERWKRE